MLPSANVLRRSFRSHGHQQKWPIAPNRAFWPPQSHALRQPLQTLKFLQAALEPHLPSGEARNLVAGIGQSLDTMASILSSLLDVNRLESGNLRPSVSEFTVSEIFGPLAEDFVALVQE